MLVAHHKINSDINLSNSCVTVEPLLSDPLLYEFSIIRPPIHSPNSI